MPESEAIEARWQSEARDLGPEPGTGTWITKFTAAAVHSINIYCEQPYTTPDGRRIAIMRGPQADPRMPPFDLGVVDLESLRMAIVERDLTSNFVGTAAWSGIIYCFDAQRRLVSFDLAALTKTVILESLDLPGRFVLQSVSPDHRYLIGQLYQPNFLTAVMRVDLRTGSIDKIFEHYEISNAHLQYNPVHGREILALVCRGFGVNDRLKRRPVEGSGTGNSQFIISADGSTLHELAIGPPHSASVCGHACWVADTGQIATTLHWVGMEHAEPGHHDPRHPEGNVARVAPGDHQPQIFPAPEHRFNHLNVSCCGRYFVADCYRNGINAPISLVVGDFESGRHATLVADCGATGGGPACSHPHAYFTADNRNVIYNADRHDLSHVYAARVPEGFLESLA